MRKLINIIRSKSDILFILLLLIIGYHYHYQEIVVKPPISVHMWRQADCASIAYNYYQNGMNFFHPEMHNLMSDDLTSGCNIGECPLINYFVAILYKVFGFSDTWYRLVVLIIYFSGLFALYKLFELFIKSKFWSISLSILFFASPNLVYYGNNFISDSPAFSFTLIGWYFFFRFYFQKRKKHFLFSIFFFTIASLLKVTAGMSVVAIAGIYLIELFKWAKFDNGKPLFEKKMYFIYPFLFLFVIVVSWYLFARSYNQFHKNNGYFLTSIWPIWTMSKDEIQLVIDNVLNIWHKIYFNISVLYLLLIFFILNIYYYRKANKMLLFILFTVFIGVIMFVILWFFVFTYHDYYVINLYILPVFVILTFFEIVNRHFKYLIESRILRIFFVVFLIFNINYTKAIIKERYNEVPNWYPFFNEVKDAKPYLKSIGFNKNDKVIVLNDFTPNYVLYMINAKGWSGFNSKIDTSVINKYIKKGAKYLIAYQKDITDSVIYKKFMLNKIGLLGDVSVFRLDCVKMGNYPMGYKEILSCDMEKLNSNNNYFLAQPESVLLDGGWLRRNEISHSGKQSLLLDGVNNLYGLTYMLNVKPGKSYYASVWTYSEHCYGSIVVNDTTGKLFRKECRDVSQKSNNGWELLELAFTIPKEFPYKRVGVYVWNPSGYPVYFDDFRVMKATFDKN